MVQEILRTDVLMRDAIELKSKQKIKADKSGRNFVLDYQNLGRLRC